MAATQTSEMRRATSSPRNSPHQATYCRLAFVHRLAMDKTTMSLQNDAKASTVVNVRPESTGQTRSLACHSLGDRRRRHWCRPLVLCFLAFTSLPVVTSINTMDYENRYLQLTNGTILPSVVSCSLLMVSGTITWSTD